MLNHFVTWRAVKAHSEISDRAEIFARKPHLLDRFLTALIMLVCCVAFATNLNPAQAKTVPEGNRSVEQPAIPGASQKRTAQLRTSFEKKYERVLNLFQNDAELVSKIKKVAAKYKVDPIHIAGAIIGEHTFNVDAYDRLQSYYIKAVSYLKSDFKFEYEGENVIDFVERDEFENCKTQKTSYNLWTCRERVWNKSFSGKTVDGVRYPRDRFSKIFFQPFFAGQTFGLGQLNPLTALQMSDVVNSVSGYPKLDANNPQRVYQTIMDPDLTLDYIAAVIKTSIDAYNSIAGFDISDNPGVTSTLYNLGDPKGRAYALRAKNGKKSGNILPEENYYGWFVNEKIDDLKALF